jgi:hypothetical protein
MPVKHTTFTGSQMPQVKPSVMFDTGPMPNTKR